MKKLIILRHTHALDIQEWFTHDFYRSLSKKWQHQAKKIWEELKVYWLKPDCIITSSAVRTFQTATIISDILELDYQKVIIHSECYRCNKNKRNEVIWYYNQYDTILICGHNPELLSLCQHFEPELETLKKWQYYVFNCND
jgi:phosphohistidine phosphatase SixA